jgi:Putative DNA-binding domain
MSLRALQRDMRAWLHHGLDDAPVRLGHAALPGLRVYRNTYRAQLIACLEESFAQTRRWIGDDDFLSLCIAHIGRVAPSSWTLDAYARDFPATVAALYPADPEVAELAALDLALGEAFVATDATPVAIGTLAGIDWDDATLRFVPSLNLLPARTNAGAIWSALMQDETPPAACLLPETGGYLVWRQDQRSCFRTIDAVEVGALVAMRAGGTFGTLCVRLVETLGEASGVTRAGELLGLWLRDGLVSAVD